ncbi:MAG: hypothetical protein ACT4PP_09250 [Sporichthyaceae bacterium]
MRTRVAAAGAGLALVATALAPMTSAVAGPCEKSAPVIHSVSAPAVAIVKSSGQAVFSVKVKASDNCEVKFLKVGIVNDAGKFSKGFDAKWVAFSGDDEVWKAKVVLSVGEGFSLDGWKVKAVAWDAGGNQSAQFEKVRDDFALKLDTRIAGLNAGPEPVAAGSPLRVTGKVQRAEFGGGWVGYASQRVSIQFRPSGGSFSEVAAVASGSDGAFSYTTRAKKSGEWRAVLAGSSVTVKATSAADVVAVN